MKKILFLVPLLIVPLSACGGGTTSSEEILSSEEISSGPIYDSETGLEVEQRDNYEFDENSSNENGSMSYEIFVRSFYDSNGDGTGDLNGIKAKIPYLADLGLKTLWLMPIHPSPTYHGYDVVDYYNVHPDYGTLADFDALVTEANKYNMEIMLDMVFNHCSIYNDWFIQSYKDFTSGNTADDSKATWFNWNEGSKSGYNRYGSTSYYYESRFDSSMPDFNFDNEAVKDEIKNICKFWIQDHGVKGFRLDAVIYYYYQQVDPNNAVLAELSEYCKTLDPDFHMVGEAWVAQASILKYYKSGIDSLFAFNAALNGSVNPNCNITSMAKGYLKAPKFATTIEAFEAKIKENSPTSYASYFLTNHDTDRASSSVEGESAKVAASIYALLPGTPFMYYGEEIELKGKRTTSPDDFSDVKRRLPMIWSKTDKTGECDFPEKNRQDLNTTVQVEEGVDDRLAEGYSLLNHYKKVINVRNKYPFFKTGVFTNMIGTFGIESEYVLAYKISEGENEAVVITNLNETLEEINVGELKIKDSINTRKLIPSLENGVLKLAPKSTVVLG